ncbi:hypothetical protein [Mucilaginibacter sp. CSA2-8R]|uniref:hypothetical protein n=1 Tax=Mucilaginibacter sp. CSA2-8R TaxID=3141542 RepID=UPI00315D7EBD
MKYIIILLLTLSASLNSFAQDIAERTRRLTPEVTEKYHVLKSNDTIMQGQYTAYLNKKLLAVGNYDQNKKIGTWTFFDKHNQPSQRYNYTTKTLLFEAPENSADGVRYIVDDSLKTDYTFSRPARIGGRYYGYLNYVNLIRLPEELRNLSNESYKTTIELLVSPGGRLAEFKFRVHSAYSALDVNDVVLSLNLKLIKDEDKIFIPAKLNGNPVSIRIIIPCQFYKSDMVRL